MVELHRTGAVSWSGRLAAALVLVSCSDAEPPPTRDALAVSPPSLALLDGLDQAILEGRGLEELTGSAGSASVDRRVFRDDFDTVDPRWVFGEQRARPPDELPERVRPGVRREGETTAFYLPFALKRMHVDLPTVPEGSYLVTARVRSFRENGYAALSLLRLSVEPGEEGRLEQVGSVENTPESAHCETHDEWQDVLLLEIATPGRRGLRITLSSGPGGMAIDSLEVRRLSLPERCHLEELRGGLPALRRHWLLAGESWDSLVLPPPARATFWARIPARARLELGTGLVAERAGDSVQLHVDIDGERVGSRRHQRGAQDARTKDTLPDRFVPWTLDLSAWAGREVEIAFETEGSDEVLGLIGSPRILAPTAAPRANSIRNVIVVSIDTLRADHLGCYGNPDGLSPTIDALAREGTRFSAVRSPSSYTLPTHVSLFTAQHPLLHGVLRGKDRIDGARSWLLGRAMRDSGRVCAAFTGGGYVHPAFGYADGFDRYGIHDPAGVQRAFLASRDIPAESVGVKAQDSLAPTLDWIDRHHDQAFFLFLHTFLVHNYVPAEDYAKRHVGSEDVGASGLELWRRARDDRDQACTQRLRELYRATLAELDEQVIGRLLVSLEQWGLRENTLIALVADHGESFLEHDSLGHGNGLWKEQTHVPWLLIGPGIPAQVVTTPVSLSDVAPTLASLLDLETDERWSGQAVDLGHPDATNPSHFLHLRATDSYWDAHVGEDFKVLARRDIHGEVIRTELYRLGDADPHEEHDLAAARPDDLRVALARLEAMKADLEGRAALLPRRPDSSGGLSESLARALEELGYMTRTPDGGGETKDGN